MISNAARAALEEALGDRVRFDAPLSPSTPLRAGGAADALAAARFKHAAKRFIHGDLHCQGVPELRAGREVELAGVSARLRGTYQVVDCVHCFDRQDGYQTHLKVQRPDWTP